MSALSTKHEPDAFPADASCRASPFRCQNFKDQDPFHEQAVSLTRFQNPKRLPSISPAALLLKELLGETGRHQYLSFAAETRLPT
jgi:hypothetical protein